jgi:hypothetical protein
VEHGVAAWNVADGPVHGNTSQLQQGIATVAQGLAPGRVVALLRLVAVAALISAVGALRGREGAVLALLGPLGVATLSSGMETALTLGLGAWFVAELRGRGRDAVLVGLAGLLYLARPDTGLLTVGSLLVRRRSGAAAAVVGVVGLLWLGLWAVYGSPVPTSFATKLAVGGEVYGPHFLARSSEARLRHALLFAWVSWPLLRALKGRGAWLAAAPGLAFVGYHLAMTVDVMGMHARFFVPALPWLVPDRLDRQRWTEWGPWVVAGMALWSVDWLPDGTGWRIGRVSMVAYASYALAVALVGRAPAWTVVVAVGLGLLGDPRPAPPWRHDAEHVEAYEGMVSSFRGLRALERCLGTDLHVLHSEIGVVGMVLHDGHVTDLGGLMSPGWTHHTVARRCRDRAPDAVFLPHRNYRRLRKAMVDGGCLEGMTQVVDRGSSPLFVRDDLLPKLAPCLSPQGR